MPWRLTQFEAWCGYTPDRCGVAVEVDTDGYDGLAVFFHVRVLWWFVSARWEPFIHAWALLEEEDDDR